DGQLSQFCTLCPKQGVSMAAAGELEIAGRLRGAAMMMPHARPPARGRRVKFTAQVIENIKKFVAQGMSRDEIANRLGVTVGSLQVTCSRLGISLRRISFIQRLTAHGRCQEKHCSYSGLARHYAPATAEGSIAF